MQNIDFSYFMHPLFEVKTVEVTNRPGNPKDDTLNNWAIASLLSFELWDTPNNVKAEESVRMFALHTGINEKRLNKLIKAMRKPVPDLGMVRELQNAIANGFQDSTFEAWQKQQNQ